MSATESIISDDPVMMTPKASYQAFGPIQGIWLQRSIESSSKIVTAINIEQLVSDDFEPHWRCELQLLTLQLSPSEDTSIFDHIASLELPEFYIWLLEGDFIVFVDALMDVRIWNWKMGQWGYIKDATNEAIDGPVR